MPRRALILDNFLPYRLSFTTNLVSERIATAYQTLFGVSIPEWRVIAHTAEHDGITQLEIGQRSRMDKVTVSRASIALTKRGVLERKPNPSDKRSHRLVLTAAGRELYSKIVPKALELERDIFATFPEDELEAFQATLRKIDSLILQI